MAAVKPDGGSAFPRPFPVQMTESAGMSLRDYLAGQALIGMIVSQAIYSATEDDDEPFTLSSTARDAYRYADAMLAERAKP